MDAQNHYELDTNPKYNSNALEQKKSFSTKKIAIIFIIISILVISISAISFNLTRKKTFIPAASLIETNKAELMVLQDKLERYSGALDICLLEFKKNSELKISSAQELQEVISNNAPKVQALEFSLNELETELQRLETQNIKIEKIDLIKEFISGTKQIVEVLKENSELDKAFVNPLRIYYQQIANGFSIDEASNFPNAVQDLNTQVEVLEKLDIKFEPLKKTYNTNKTIFKETSAFFADMIKVYNSSDNNHSKSQKINDISSNFTFRLSELEEEQDENTRDLQISIQGMLDKKKDLYSKI